MKGDLDYICGQAIANVRTRIGMTQEGLANHLGVTRKSVAGWEAGSFSPNVEHLKGLIVLAVQRRVFAAENAVEEIRVLWQVTHQKVSLDERWLAVVLDQQCSLSPQVLPARMDLSTERCSLFPQVLPARMDLSVEMPLHVQINFVLSVGGDEAVLLQKRYLTINEVIAVLNRSYHAMQESIRREQRDGARQVFNVCYEWLRSRNMRFSQIEQREWVLKI